MKHLHLKTRQNTIEDSLEFKRLFESASNKSLSKEEQGQILRSIRNGELNSIPKLVESLEETILLIIIQLDIDYINVEEQLNEGKKAVFQLAENEINSISSEKFYDFCAWTVKQAILELTIK